MGKKILVSGLLIMGCLTAGNAYAVGMGGSGQDGSGSGIHEPGTGLENPELKEGGQGTGQGTPGEAVPMLLREGEENVGDGVQERARNQGEEPMLQNERQENAMAGNGEMIRSNVANAVQEMLQIAERNGGIGEQVRVIAQEQNMNHEQLGLGLQKIQSRSAFSKFLIGPNYGEINKAKGLIEKNRDRIQELTQLREQMIESEDAGTLEEQVSVLQQANMDIEEALMPLEKGFSLFGWMVRLFAR